MDLVAPEWGWRGESTEIAISGSAFFPDVQVSTYDAAAGRVDAAFQVWLETPGRVSLGEVQLLDYQTLTAEVPEGLEVGLYDLSVVTPSGLIATLADAFSVTDTRADHLAIRLADAAYDVNQEAEVHLGLEDPDDVAVAQDLEVELRASSDLGASGVHFRAGGLVDQVELSDPPGIRGRLDDAGTATVLVTSTVPDDVSFTLSAVSDPVVDPDAALVSWEPGALTRIEIVLPEADFRATAGEPFDVDLLLYDRDGNELGPQATEVILYETCGALRQTVDLSEPGPWSIELTTACASNTLQTFGLGIEDGASAPFAVLAGPQAGLAVTAYPDPVVAGSGLLLVQVDAVDAYTNTVPGAVGTVVLTDSVGGLDPARAIGSQNCGTFDDGRLLCTASPIVAADGVVLSARDDAGFSGRSNPVEVLPDVPQELSVFVDTPTLVAGDPFGVVVGVRDAWGNGIPFDAGGSEPVAFEDDTATLACRYEGPYGTDAAYTCSVTQAVDADVIGGSVIGLQGTAPGTYPVLNGALGDVEIELFSTTYTAGVPFTAHFTGYDDYGNLYTFPTSGAAFDISDPTDSVTPDTAFFDVFGETSIAAEITVAADGVYLLASQGGILLGQSDSFTVLPGPMAGFSVSVAPWIDVAAGGTVVINAVDAYDNVVPTYTGSVRVEPAAGLCEAQESDSFAAGRLELALDCPDVGFQETLHVDDGAGMGGDSDGFDVLDFACTDGPTAALALDGGVDVVACLVSGTAAVDADASGTTAGATPVAIWHLVDDEGDTHRAVSSSQTFTYTSAGTRRITTVAADTRGCASEASGLAYIGTDDGSPTGPLVVTAGAGSVATGASTTVEVTALDCAGDIPTSGSLRVRADLGELAGTATGTGLEVPLDAAGVASVDWSFPTGFAGEATFTVGTTSGSAQGATTVTVTGDSVRPEVVSVTPTGQAEGTVDSIEVVFNEEMRALSVVADAIDLSGPDGPVALSVTVSDDLTRATLTPATEVDAEIGEWTLTLSDRIRDIAGNKLSGDWSGDAAAFVTTFGDVDLALPEVSSCAVSLGRFYPDGDDGTTRESDSVTLTPTTTGPPAWWWLEVEDGDGNRVRSQRTPGTDTTVAWDARGDDGRIVPSGTYLARLSVADESGNVRAQCESGLSVDQHVELR